MYFDPKSAALILIDLQVGFCGKEGHTSKQGRNVSEFKSVLDSAGRLAAAARLAGMPVILTRMAYAPDYSNGGLTTSALRPNLERDGALRVDRPDADIMPELDAQSSDIILDKQRYSALIKTDLEQILVQRKIDSIVVGGVTTSMCVESTVRDLAMHDYKCFIVSEACGDLNPDWGKRAMELFAMAFGRVVSETDILAAIKANGREFTIQ